VPFGYFAYAAVARKDVTRRESAVKQFWKDWRLGNVQHDFVREVGVRYVVVRKTPEDIPATVSDIFSKVFENSEFAVFKVDSKHLSETGPESP
jgi:hypothetical protein